MICFESDWKKDIYKLIDPKALTWTQTSTTEYRVSQLNYTYIQWDVLILHHTSQLYDPLKAQHVPVCFSELACPNSQTEEETVDYQIPHVWTSCSSVCVQVQTEAVVRSSLSKCLCGTSAPLHHLFHFQFFSCLEVPVTSHKTDPGSDYDLKCDP